MTPPNAPVAAACRVCGQTLPGEELLRLDNMPRQAQRLPLREELATERGVSLELYQCSGCGLVQLAGAPVPYYREVIRAAAFSREMGEFRRRQFREFVGRFDLDGKQLLEVGCGHGEYLALWREAGVIAYGLEQGGDGVAACHAAGLEVEQGFIADAGCSPPQAPFSAFACLNFLEHLPQPGAFLKGVHRVLAPGAIGLVEVPNFDMILQRRMLTEFIADHLLYFTRQTLTTALQLNGFEVLECAALWHDYLLSATVRRREPLDLTGFQACNVELTRQLDAFIARFPQGRVAVWGAGHQALAVMALARLQGRIRYVVDSAPFKQGRFTPATHLPIVPPETLTRDPVAAVIVMAASYSDEVVGTLRERFDAGLTIAVLREEGLQELSWSIGA